jgi:hypothetical protein
VLYAGALPPLWWLQSSSQLLSVMAHECMDDS